MSSIGAVVDRATKDPDFLQRLSEDPFGAISSEGYDVSPDEVRQVMDLHGTSDGELVEALKARLSHALGAS